MFDVNVLNSGYLKDDKINTSNLLDLLTKAQQIVKKGSNNFTAFDTFFSGSIVLASGDQQKISIGQNETGKFTIMLPEDY